MLQAKDRQRLSFFLKLNRRLFFDRGVCFRFVGFGIG